MVQKHAQVFATLLAVTIILCACKSRPIEPTRTCRSEIEEPQFDYKKIKTIGIYGGCPEVNSQLKQWLVGSPQYKVIERSRLADSVMKEIVLGKSGAVDPMTGVQAGRVIGLDGIIVVECFGRDVSMSLVDSATGEILASMTECYRGYHCHPGDAAWDFVRWIHPREREVCS